jgi:hypothetical protein
MNNVTTSSANASYAVISNVSLVTAEFGLPLEFCTVIANSKAIILNHESGGTSLTSHLDLTTIKSVTVGADPMPAGVTVSATDTTNGTVTLSTTISGGTSGVSMITGVMMGDEYYQYARISSGSNEVSIQPFPKRLNVPSVSLTPSGTFISPSLAVRCRSLTASSKILLGLLSYGTALTAGQFIPKPLRFSVYTNNMLSGDGFWSNVYNYFIVAGALHNSFYSYNVVDA